MQSNEATCSWSLHSKGREIADKCSKEEVKLLILILYSLEKNYIYTYMYLITYWSLIHSQAI